MIVGAVTVILWKNLLASTGIYEITGFILATAVMIVVSLLGKAPNAQVVQRFEEAERIYQQSK